jgi:hypothetical protein
MQTLAQIMEQLLPLEAGEMPLEAGDRVIYASDGGPDAGMRGTVKWIEDDKFLVRWDDGEEIDYRHHVGSCIRKLEK